MNSIDEHYIASLSGGERIYKFTRQELKGIGASQFRHGDIIKVSKYSIYIRYRNERTQVEYSKPCFCSYVETEDFKRLCCTAGVHKGFTPYYIDDFLWR